MNRNEITEQQITELMQAISKADEVDALRADAERFRWLAAQTSMRIDTDGTVWHHGRGRNSFRVWGGMCVNDRVYPVAPSLAELVDMARADQGEPVMRRANDV